MNRPIPFIGEQPFIFISYSHRNTETVWDTLNDLQKDGFRFWYDDGIEPGVSWDDYIADHINGSGYFIAFVSAEYAESKNCIQELRFAIESNKPVLLIRLDEKKLSSGLEMRLCTYQAINRYEIDDAEYLERIESAEGIDGFRAKEEVVKAHYSYKEKYPKLIRVLKQSYYCEAMFLEHELIDDIFFWILYNMGLIANPESTKIRSKVRPALREIYTQIGEPRDSLGITTLEAKLDIVKALLQWAASESASPVGDSFEVLRNQLSSGNIAEQLSLLGEISIWNRQMKMASDSMLKKNMSVSDEMNSTLAANGQSYAKTLNILYKDVRKGNKVRKAFGLK